MAESKFYEESAGSQRSEKEAKWYTVFHVAGIIFFVIAVVFGMFMALVMIPGIISKSKEIGASPVFSIIIGVVWVLSFVAIGVVFWFLKKRFNISYDYVFVEDELRITKVFNGRKRKYLYLIKALDVLKIGYCDSDSYQETLKGMQGKKPKLVTPNTEPSEGKDFIYVLQSEPLGKQLYVLECRKMLLEFLVRAAGVNKFVRK